jgi:hypothetical protein
MGRPQPAKNDHAPRPVRVKSSRQGLYGAHTYKSRTQSRGNFDTIDTVDAVETVIVVKSSLLGTCWREGPGTQEDLRILGSWDLRSHDEYLPSGPGVDLGVYLSLPLCIGSLVV